MLVSVLSDCFCELAAGAWHLYKKVTNLPNPGKPCYHNVPVRRTSKAGSTRNETEDYITDAEDGIGHLWATECLASILSRQQCSLHSRVKVSHVLVSVDFLEGWQLLVSGFSPGFWFAPGAWHLSIEKARVLIEMTHG